MAARINEHLIINGDGMEMQFYLNDGNSIFCSPTEDSDAMHFWFTFSKEDWEVMKQFIDEQFEQVK